MLLLLLWFYSRWLVTRPICLCSVSVLPDVKAWYWSALCCRIWIEHGLWYIRGINCRQIVCRTTVMSVITDCSCCLHEWPIFRLVLCWSNVKGKKVKFSHTLYQALGLELILVYHQSARRWLFQSYPGRNLPLLSTRPAVTFPLINSFLLHSAS